LHLTKVEMICQEQRWPRVTKILIFPNHRRTDLLRIQGAYVILGLINVRKVK